MPIYDYYCVKCGVDFEQYHSRTDDGEEDCPMCGTSSKRFNKVCGHKNYLGFVPPPLAVRKFGEEKPMPPRRKKWL